MQNMQAKVDLRNQILELVNQYAKIDKKPKLFVAGETVVPPSGKIIGSNEMQMMVDSVLDGWLTAGRFNSEFESRLGKFLGRIHVLTTTSGSSANLLALTALTSPKLGEKALKPGDEVITVAAGFPTTVNPILQNGLVPVFVDVDIPTYNINASLIENAISERTKAIMIAHTLGNPFDLFSIKKIADKYGLWLIEDCCDALGTTYDGKMVGTFGDISTCSFYPAHHITMGEGGAVMTKSGRLRTIIESFRDWGRDCFCPPGKDNTCKKRFSRQMGGLPQGYDHKYTYSHIGYNLKITDMQAACGLAQMDNLEFFIKKRKENFKYLSEALQSCTDFLILPEATKHSDPAWFGFPITLKESAPFSRVDLLNFLDQRHIGSRLLFAGNLTQQPYFKDLKYRVSGTLENTDLIMNNTFWLGVYPGLGEQELGYIASSLAEFLGCE